MILKTNLSNFPVKASPQSYEKWFKAFTAEIQEKYDHVIEGIKTSNTVAWIAYSNQLLVLREVLGVG